MGAHRIELPGATKPIAQDGAVDQGFPGSKALGNQDPGSARRIKLSQDGLDIAAVHIGHEVQSEPPVVEVLQRVHHQPGPQVGATHADIDDIGHAGAGQLVHQPGHAGPRGSGQVDGFPRDRAGTQ